MKHKLFEKRNRMLYSFTQFGTVLYYGSILIALMLLLTRNRPALWQHLPYLQQAALNTHISNLSISYTVLVGSGLAWLKKPKARSSIALLAAALISMNFIVELWVTFINTPDIGDAYAGLVGVALGLACLYVLDKFGTVPVTKKRK